MKINLNKLFKFPAINLLLKEKIVNKEEIISKYNRSSSPSGSMGASLSGKKRNPKPVFSIAFLALAPLNIRRLYSRFKKLVLLICLTGLVLSQISFAQGAGRGLTFDNTSTEYVVIGDDASLNLTTTFTVEAWVKTTSITSDKQALYCRKKVSGSKGYCFGIFNAEVVVGIDGNDFLSTGAGLTTNTWYHIAGTFDTNANLIYIYVNGVERLAESTIKNVTSATVAPNLGRTTAAGDYFEGTLDEVRVWSDVRTLTEIRDNMCKKLTGSEANLVAYWRLDESSGTSCDNAQGLAALDGTMMSMEEADHVWSGAALGDASVHDYVNVTKEATIAHGDGDNIKATATSGSPVGIQVYRVDATSMRTDATKPVETWTMDPLRYWGVFVCGGTSPTYTVTYNYDGHPGITTESDLGLAYRGDHSVNAWADLGATLDDGANTLTKTGQSGTEYALGSPSGDNSLPVELSGFTAISEMSVVILRWTTESEIENLGFILERRLTNSGYPEPVEEWTKIASYKTHEELQGQGSVTHRTEYRFVDNTVKIGKTYDYRLADVSYDGVKEYHSMTVMGVTVTEPIPDKFTLRPAYPNPFNPVTTISYDLPKNSQVELVVYNILGQKVIKLVDHNQVAGRYTVQWNGQDTFGRQVSPGVYFYLMIADEFTKTRRMLLLK